MADLDKMVKRWLEKFTPARAKQTLEAVYDEMAKNYARAMVDLLAMEDQTRQVLNQSGIQSALYVPYLDFARQLFALKRKGISGRSFQMAADVLLAKWSARGLNPIVLEKIRQEVFDSQKQKDL
ncbi:MAG: hypothetical protein ABIK23_01800 [candidate division WOR-3 bacterium]